MKELCTQIKKIWTKQTKNSVGQQNNGFRNNEWKVMNKIESEVFQANWENYLLNENKNWSLLHNHVFPVEQ